MDLMDHPPVWNILLIDDDEDDYILVRTLLANSSQGKYRLEWAGDYDAGVQALETGQYDAILLDYYLGAHLGVDLLNEVHAAECSYPFILLTGKGSADIDLQSLEAGALLHLSKNELTTAFLERGIQYAIDRRRLEIQLRRSEAALQQSEKRFLAVYENAPVAISLTRLSDNVLIDVNPSFLQIFGFSREEVVGKTAAQLKILHEPETRDRMVALVAAGESVKNREIRYRTKTGEMVILSVNLNRVTIDGVDYALGTSQDVTASRLAEQALEEAHADLVSERSRLLAVMEALPVGLAIYDMNGGVIQCNRQFEEVWGSPRPDANSIEDYDLYKAWWAESGERVKPEEWAAARAVQHGESITGQYIRIQRFNGTSGYILNSGAPVRNARGEIIGGVVAIMDITERVQAENALRESERLLKTSDERFRVALSALPMMVYILDRDLRFTWVYNPRLGLPTEQMLGKRDDEVYPPDVARDLIDLKQQALNSGQHVQRELRAEIGGEVMFYMVSLEPLRDAAGAIIGLIGASLDVTEQRRLETERREALTQMEIQRRLSEFREKERQEIARDIHDGPIQTLVSLLFNVQIAKEAMTDGMAKMEFAQIGLSLQQTVRELREVVNELRPPSLIRFGLGKTLNLYVDDFHDKHPAIQVHTDLPDDAQNIAEDTRLALFRICQEALTNVVRHAQASEVWLSLQAEQDRIILEIRDNGKGMPSAASLVDQTSYGHYGLAGMNERAEAIGGQLSIVSIPGEGTTVRVEVPVAK